MHRALLVASLVAATSTVASAGTYLGLGIGTAPSVGGDMPTFSNDGSRSERLLLGFRFGRFSIEGDGTRYGLLNDGRAQYTGSQLAAALKFSYPLGNNFEVFARGGLERTWLTTDTDEGEFSGNGWLLGGGFEYRVNLGVVGGSIFVDYTHNDTSFTASSGTNMKSLDGTAGMFSLGLTVSL